MDHFPTLGILGGGQLGKMMAQAALRLGAHVRFLSPKEAGPMQGFGEQTVADWTDPEVLRAFASECDAITVESEWAPIDELAEVLPAGVRLFPRPETLAWIRDKGIQNDRLAEHDIPLPDYRRCATIEEALDAAETFGYPVVAKKYRGAYDGYGNATADDEGELRAAWNDLADEDGMLVETFVPFVRELSVIVARTAEGDHAEYPVAYTIQRDHRCHAVVVPAPIDPIVEKRAVQVAHEAVDAVDGVGVTAVELFETEEGDILVNELAPRPHNTGHHTIESCHTSQFENHVRAVLGWPLGKTDRRVPHAVMVNVLGLREGTARTTGLEDALAVEGATVHIYGKPQVRENRKMGHVTVTGTSPEIIRERAERAAAYIEL